MKVLELRGIKSYFALQAYGKLLLGLKMLPMHLGQGYSEFFKLVESMSPADQEKTIREGVFLVDLNQDEIEALARFCADTNGAPYSRESLKNLEPEKIFEIIVAVCLECAKIKPKLLTDAEKKN